MVENLIQNIEKAIEADKQKPNLGMIDLEKAKELYKNGAIILDVRPPAKVSGKTMEEAGIKNAMYIPVVEFTKHLNRLPQNKDTVIIITCNLVKFANRAMGYLEAFGYINVYAFDGSTQELMDALAQNS
jgi:rhodanese-related sulfurtransferase